MIKNQNVSNEKDLLITHVFNASRDIVFRAWTDPQYLKEWFAPDGCTIEYKKIEVRENGKYHSQLHDPLHGDCWIKGIYHEVVVPEKLVFSSILTNEAGEDMDSVEAGKPKDWPNEIMTTVTFTAIGNSMKVTVHQTVPEVLAKKTGAYQSWFKMFVRLESNLVQPVNEKHE